MATNENNNSGWRVVGFDTFSNEEYPINGPFSTEDAALELAREKFAEIELTQSGGQEENGIQDRLFIQKPDGTRYRFLPPELKNEI